MSLPLPGSRRGLQRAEENVRQPYGVTHTREQVRWAPHVLILDQITRINEELSAGRDPSGAFDALCSLVDPLAFADPAFPAFYDELGAASRVCDFVERELGAVPRDVWVRLHYPAYVGLLDRLGVKFRPRETTG